MMTTETNEQTTKGAASVWTAGFGVVIACAKWLGRTSSTCTRKPDGCICEKEELNEMGMERTAARSAAHDCTTPAGPASAETGAGFGFRRDAGGMGLGRGDADMAGHGLTPNA